MAPRKAVDKGKRPMVEEPTLMRQTRSRSAGVMIRESEPTRARGQERDRPEPTHVAQQSDPQVEEAERERSAEPAQGPGTSSGARSGDTQTTEGLMSPQELQATMLSILGMVQELRQQSSTQGRTPVGPTPSPIEERVQSELNRPQVMPSGAPAAVDVRDDRDMMRSFQDLRPPEFRGESDLRAVEEWVAEIEKIFRYIRCTDGQKVRFATFMLKGDADRWWTSEMQILPRQGEDLSWPDFLQRFMTQFVPRTERDRKAADFAALTQGKMSVSEYDLQFRTLSRYVRWTQFDQEEAARKFRDGLKPSIRGKMAVARIEGYAPVVEMARQVEREEEMWARSQESRRVIYPPMQLRGQGQRGRGRFRRGQPQRQQKPRQLQLLPPAIPTCTICGNQHRGPCFRGTGQYFCYRCGQTGHFARECPVKPDFQGIQHQPPARMQQAVAQRGRGRPPQFQQQRRPPAVQQRQQVPVVVNAVTPQQAQATDGVVTGSLIVCNCLAFVLFDSGASHSFISADFVARAQVPKGESREIWCISTPVGAMCSTTEICRKCPVYIEGRRFWADLIVLDMKGFDVILGMDWLSLWNATVL